MGGQYFSQSSCFNSWPSTTHRNLCESHERKIRHHLGAPPQQIRRAPSCLALVTAASLPLLDPRKHLPHLEAVPCAPYDVVRRSVLRILVCEQARVSHGRDGREGSAGAGALWARYRVEDAEEGERIAPFAVKETVCARQLVVASRKDAHPQSQDVRVPKPAVKRRCGAVQALDDPCPIERRESGDTARDALRVDPPTRHQRLAQRSQRLRDAPLELALLIVLVALPRLALAPARSEQRRQPPPRDVTHDALVARETLAEFAKDVGEGHEGRLGAGAAWRQNRQCLEDDGGRAEPLRKCAEERLARDRVGWGRTSARGVVARDRVRRSDHRLAVRDAEVLSRALIGPVRGIPRAPVPQRLERVVDGPAVDAHGAVAQGASAVLHWRGEPGVTHGRRRENAASEAEQRGRG